MDYFLAVEKRLTRTALELAVLCMSVVVALTFYQVVTRFVFGHPSTWSEVAARSAMIWMVFLGLAVAFRLGVMIAVDLLLDIAPRPLRRTLFIVIALASLVFLAILVWYGTGMVLRVRNQNLAGMHISIAWVYAALPSGALLAAPAVVARLIEVLRDDDAYGSSDSELRAEDVEG